jgi:hypothetical protein
MCLKSCDKTSTFRLTAAVLVRHQKVSQYHVTKHQHFAGQPVGHHECVKKPCDKMYTFPWTAGLCQRCVQKSCDKRPLLAQQLAGHHKCQKSCD